MSAKKICLVAAAQYTVEVFLLDQILQLSKRHDVTLFVKTDDPGFLERRGIFVRVVPAPLERRISLFQDIHALVFLFRAFRENAFDLVHSTTPKGGLLAMIAGFFARVPIRIHTFTGQVWGTRLGVIRSILKTADRITAWAATYVLMDSFSQREFLVQQRIVSKQKSGVLGHGSISGVNIERFTPNALFRHEIRGRHGISQEAIVYLFMARLTRDKGALVMAEGFAKFIKNGGEAILIVVGPDEEGLRPKMLEIFGPAAEKVYFDGYTTVPEQFMAAADIFCLPSYREGFGTVFINAAAVGIPAIASRIYGSEEAIQDGITGLLHEAGDSDELAQKMSQLAVDPKLRQRLGQNAQERVRRDFSEASMTAAVLSFYDQLLSSRDV